MNQLRLAHSIVALLVGTLAVLPGVAQNQLWLQQLGSLGDDYAFSIAADGAGGVYRCGSTSGALNGPNAGGLDAWIGHYDGVTGVPHWLRQFGTNDDEFARGVAPDGSGGAYMTGYKLDSLGGQVFGEEAVWIARYDNVGNQLWIRQLGSSDVGAYDFAFGATPDGSAGVYVTGYTSGSLGGPSAGSNDAWLARYDSTGLQLWIRQLGSSGHDTARAAAADGSGGVYIAGETSGSLGGTHAGIADAWVARYDASGNQVWIRQLGTSSTDTIYSAAQDGCGGVFVGGSTAGDLAGTGTSSYGAWFAHFDASGNQSWIRQFGTHPLDAVNAVAPDGWGGVYVAGRTFGSLAAPNAGPYDTWVAQYDDTGAELWMRQFGTNLLDEAICATPDGVSGVFLGGGTKGALSALNAGGWDTWFARYNGVGPPPPKSYCTASTTAAGCSASISANTSPSATFSTPCVLNITNVEGQRQGLVFYGLDNAGFSPLPWSSGSSSFLCVKPPMQRTSLQNSGGAIASCNGTLTLDWNAFHSANPGALGSALAAGSKVYAQGWFRDPPATKGVNLSNALKLLVAP